MAVNHIMHVWQFNAPHLLVKLCKLRQRAGFTKSFPCFGLVYKDLFCFFMLSMWAENKCSYIQNMWQTMLHLWWEGHSAWLPALSSEWVTRYESNATQSLSASISLSLSHFWHNTSIQLSGLIMFHACAPALTAVLSYFTPFDASLCHQ